jgi:dethiobiotin synthetase
MRGLTITGTGTGVGKTFVTRAIACALRRAGQRVAALKPYETGVDDERPVDAIALAAACGRPELASAAAFYRARASVAPFAATLLGEATAPTAQAIAAAVIDVSADADVVLVEGAGGLFVPIGPKETFADVARAVGHPILLVAVNVLGALSHVLTAVSPGAAARRSCAAWWSCRPRCCRSG